MLRRRLERPQLVAAEREKDAARHGTERRDCGRHVCDLDPMVAVDGFPGRSLEDEQRSTCERDSLCGVGGNLQGIGMRCVDQHIDRFCLEECSKAGGAAEAADSHRHRLRGWSGGASGERQRHREVGARREAFCEAPGLRCAAENEDAFHGAC